MKEKFDGLIEYLFGAGIFLPQAIEVLEKAMIQRAMVETGGNRCAASKQLGIHRNTLQRKLEEYGMSNGRPRLRRKPPVRQGRARKRGAA
jgi:Fis family transcriptional regulator